MWPHCGSSTSSALEDGGGDSARAIGWRERIALAAQHQHRAAQTTEHGPAHQAVPITARFCATSCSAPARPIMAR